MALVADVLGDGRDELVLLNAREIVVFANPVAAQKVRITLLEPLPTATWVIMEGQLRGPG